MLYYCQAVLLLSIAFLSCSSKRTSRACSQATVAVRFFLKEVGELLVSGTLLCASEAGSAIRVQNLFARLKPSSRIWSATPLGGLRISSLAFVPV